MSSFVFRDCERKKQDIAVALVAYGREKSSLYFRENVHHLEKKMSTKAFLMSLLFRWWLRNRWYIATITAPTTNTATAPAVGFILYQNTCNSGHND